MKNVNLVSGLLLLGVLMSAAPARAQVTVGSAAPEFTLPGADGQEHRLSDYRGKFVVLEWVNHECPFVKKHYDSENMQNLQKEYTSKGVVWLSINSSSPGKQGHVSAAEAASLTSGKRASPTAVLLDGDGKVGKEYGAQTTPHMFIINPQGNVIYQGAIDSIASTDLTDIPKATNYVKQALDEAMAGQEVSVPTSKSYGCSVKY